MRAISDWCDKCKNEDDISLCSRCEDGSEYIKRTNADRIRSMTDEELANENVYFASEFVAQKGLRYTGLDGHYYRTGAEAVEANMKWLQSEVEESDERQIFIPRKAD